jgi:hypothetical protein
MPLGISCSVPSFLKAVPFTLYTFKSQVPNPKYSKIKQIDRNFPGITLAEPLLLGRRYLW